MEHFGRKSSVIISVTNGNIPLNLLPEGNGLYRHPMASMGQLSAELYYEILCRHKIIKRKLEIILKTLKETFLRMSLKNNNFSMSRAYHFRIFISLSALSKGKRWNGVLKTIFIWCKPILVARKLHFLQSFLLTPPPHLLPFKTSCISFILKELILL